MSAAIPDPKNYTGKSLCLQVDSHKGELCKTEGLVGW